MAKKTYVVAEGTAFTAMGHIFAPGEEISESVFADKVYFAKMISQGRIVEVKKNEAPADETSGEETAEAPTDEVPVEETTEAPADETSGEETAEAPAEETTGTKKSTSKGGK